MINEVLSHSEFLKKPPVLLDIGASGKIHPKWKKIAPYSVCIAFDADEREIDYLKEDACGYKKLYLYNCIASNTPDSELEFYLTQSPFCSSLLPPDQDSLSDYSFADLFKIVKKTKIKAKELKSVFGDLELDYVDWFKTDSQGMDLRLFKNLGENLISTILVAEFEPGFIDAYVGEDKIHHLLKDFDNYNFWLSSIEINGAQRIKENTLDSYFSQPIKKRLLRTMKVSPGWAGITYFTILKNSFTKRDVLLCWIFAVIEEQYGYAIEIAEYGKQTFPDPIFEKMILKSLSYIKLEYIKGLPFYYFNKIKNKVINHWQ